MSPSNLNNVACVIDTECTYISRTPRMVYHFGATIGNLDNGNKFDVITMDYYVKEIIENVGMFLHTNSKGMIIALIKIWLILGKTLLIIHTRLNLGKA